MLNEVGKSGNGWCLLYILELEVKFIAKSLALSDENEITSESSIMKGKFASIKYCICNFAELEESKVFVPYFNLECLHIAGLCIFQDIPVMTACSSE